jgi:5'-deoxynucleotidase YfbR-like HD superfamily hydrolase
MNHIEQALALREGGQTQRCHTMQFIGQYNIAIHSYNALSLLLLLHEEPSINLIKAVLWHDAPERWTGDVPTPAKLASPMLWNVLASLEERILSNLGIGALFKDLAAGEKEWLDAVDLLELFIWGKEQVEFGNRTVRPMNEQIKKIFSARRARIPKSVWNFVQDFSFSRSPECHDLIKGESE